MIGERDDQHRMLPWVSLFVILVILGVGILFLVLFLTNRGGEVVGSSSEESTTSESSSIPLASSTSIYDDYIDVTIENLKVYTEKEMTDTHLSPMTVKTLYSFNIYSESTFTHINYGYIPKEKDDIYVIMDIILDNEVSDLEAIGIIHDNLLVLGMSDASIYMIVPTEITNKESFKSEYRGSYEHVISYVDDYDQYYMSGIGTNKEEYISIGKLAYDHSSYDINSATSHINSVSNNRYYELLKQLA